MNADLAAGVGDAGLQSETLESLRSSVNYHAWLTDLALPFLGDRPIEVGSGLGDYADAWLSAGIPSITVTDVEPSRLQVLHDRFDGDGRVAVQDLDLMSGPAGDYSCLVGFNVLEHIADDVAALRAAHRLLRPGGAVVMFVPAFNFAMGDFDRQVGHFRRYRRRTLQSTYESAGLRIERLHYVNAPGLLAWTLAVKVLGMTPGDGLSVRLYDRLVVPVVRALERRRDPPFGQSLLAVGRTPS